ncbi:MEDS domain-containing protein [Halorussus salinisoli]|uniref:MEDS domain-containing protein n=1 Tax=Halorussus salinisoli TaxID=2558242 RepID=UPI0010C1E329|nr:MEDS domain-containing protein [Halorussus salinisoli]
MSEHASPTAGTGNPVTLRNGLEAFESSVEFDGPVEQLDGHYCNDHFAQIYESDAERFAAAVPFVRHGLEQGERVMYVVDETNEAEVRAALRSGDIDVDAALDSGALSFHTAKETYLQNDSFDPDEMVEFYGDTVAAATEEYEALRILAETSWLDGNAIPSEQFMEYEAKVNQLFDAEDCLALCQYDRNGFPPEFIRNIVRSHPHLIYDGTACHNVYYTPPAEVFDDDPDREVDRMLGTLRDRTEARAELQQRDRFLQDLYTITADQSKSFEEKIHALLDLGCEQFGLDVGGVNRVDPEADYFEVEYLNGDHELFEPGAEFPLADTYCQAATDIEAAALVSDPVKESLDDVPVFDEFGIEGYIGTYIPVNGGMDRTLGFLPAENEPVSFSEQDRTYLELIGQWVSYELNRRQREQFLRECYQITADPDREFEEKVEHLLELGRDWFDLDMAGLHHLPSDNGKFQLEQGVGLDVDPDELLITDPGEGAYCRQAIASDQPVGMPDVRGTDWEDDQIYEELGVTSYLGTTVSGGSTPFGTLWFGSTDPRDVPFSEVEHTFLDLMGQWIGYELERRRRERFLRECYGITADPDLSFEEKLEQLLELGREQFDVEMAGLNHLPSWDGPFRLEKGVGFNVDSDTEVWTDPGEGCFCRQTIEQDEPVAMADVSDTDWAEDTIHQQFGLTSYLGTKVMSGATPYGTLWFGSTNSRNRSFSETERTFLELMGQWVSYELERREHKQDQQELYRITADRDLSTDEKIAELLELGCERFDLPVGMLTRKREEAFEITKMRGSHPELDEGTLTPPLTDNYCRRVVDTGSTIIAADTGEAGWDGDALYHEFGLKCYAGVQLTVGDEAYGTICFTDLSPRDVEFTEAEETFLELMGQCVSYELERNHREAQLEHKNDRLESFASMLAHELRNPVAIGQIYSQQLPDEADAEAVEYVTDAFDRIEDMVDVLLILTRGREAISERTPVDLADMVHKAWDTVEAPNAVLDTELDQTIEADETYIRHLFRNLLENTVEHGGEDVTIRVGNLDDGFYVADDGTGIPPEDRNVIFDEGYTTAADNGGTGLGLAFVQKLAEVYEWDITVTESEDGGARFEFRDLA